MPESTLFVGGSVFDGHSYAGAAEVLVRDGRVVGVGPDLERDGAEVVDAAGGLVAPGFVDAHVHAVQGGLERIRCDLTAGGTREDYLRIVAAYAEAHPELPWILGGGWAMSAFPGGTPTAAELDAVVPDRPVCLPNRDHHGAWVNSRALALAGVDASTPDPPHGRFERDAAGRPTGTLHEGAMHVVARLVPATTDAEYDTALLEGQRYLHSLGVVGWQDAIVGAYAGMDDPGPAYVRAAARGDLTASVVGALWWDRERGEEQVESLIARRDAYSAGRFRATSVKIMQDGVAENFTAALSAPYLDRCGHATTNAGHSFVDPDALRRYVARLDAEGFQVHVHAIGDRGVREALDAFVGTDPRRRHHLAHLQLVHPDDVPRFAELGVAANLQMLWACLDEQMADLTLPFLGPVRSGWQYPFGDLLRADTLLVAGSDWPVSSPDPLEAIHVGVNRWAYGEPGAGGSEPFLPDQRLPLEAAFAAYTSGSAWINGRDDAGVLRPGATADVVVLDRDPFTGPVDEVAAASVTSTWIDGVPVHRA
ncbi:amidohydrolase [Mumia sp. Pv 4-285]|uniref:amidohydrolase n=1 Tax=Mumia qirimensis TaxID=3234852 RepID=UPI00351CCE40